MTQLVIRGFMDMVNCSYSYIISRDVITMKAVAEALVRPNLEYCVQLWNPAVEHGNCSLILGLESVQ